MPSVLLLSAGFLLAVLWMDLMFDVQVLRYRSAAQALPEEVLRSIAGYYRRVTTDARPMGHLVGAVMAALLVALAVQIAAGEPAALPSLPFCAGPILLAFARVLPNAVRLGARAGSASEQSALARAICRDHLLCFAGIVGFAAIRLLAT
jgi:hypothetical protein